MAVSLARRVALGLFPTPLHPVPALGAVPGLQDLLVKRDDLTGYCWGGNKVRTLEYILADALGAEADTIVVAGGPASNFAALLAVAAASHGLAVEQVSYGVPRRAAALALSTRAGAHITFTGSDDRSGTEVAAEQLAANLRSAGRRVYVVPRGGATPVGARGFADAAVEVVKQLTARRLAGPATVVIPVGSGGSLAGLLAGLGVAGQDGPVGSVVGVAVTRAPADVEHDVSTCSASCASLIGASPPSTPWRLVDGRHPTTDLSVEILRRAGLVADPVYNAKALSWLAHNRAELPGPIVYWSTGGALSAADDLTKTTAEASALGEEASP